MNQRYFFIQVADRSVRVDIGDIICITTGNVDELVICTTTTIHRALLSFAAIASLLPAESFCRVNEYSIVAYDHIAIYDEVSVTLTNKMTLHCDEMCRKILHQQVLNSSNKN